MSDTITLSIADIYGQEWWERNREELDREWEWSFRLVYYSNTYAMRHVDGIVADYSMDEAAPRIILHRRKPKPPTLREVYGTDEVPIPVGWEWTGEWRHNKPDEWALAKDGVTYTTSFQPRLILRERPKKVWFKAEEKMRRCLAGDWVWVEHKWVKATEDTPRRHQCYLCATRHEEVDQTVQVVTQADIDALTQLSK